MMPLRKNVNVIIYLLFFFTSAVDKKEVITRLSDIFRLMAELQGTCDIEDYTVNQSSLEQVTTYINLHTSQKKKYYFYFTILAPSILAHKKVRAAKRTKACKKLVTLFT